MSHERRRYVRAPLFAQVTLIDGERCLGIFSVLNLSAGGVLLAGQAHSPPNRKITAILELPGCRPLRAEATLARNLAEHDELTFALNFTRISSSAQDALQRAVLATLEEARAAHVLIVAPPTGLELSLKRDLKKLGRDSFHVASLAEAERFFDMQNSVSHALIGDSPVLGDVATLLQTLAAQQPEILRVVMVDDGGAAPALAQELLTMPASPPELRRILHLRPRRRTATPLPAPPSPIRTN